ncbi:ATP-grasp domain-containing protein [Streptomyces sp. NBC_00691]|uniref:ATP-grasp domain-containing protein n=1 Tax=Streptomyces sp. NBC_00691 TaxID=2903671 RepID=UPI002E30E0D7|nr:hypothetical protein [Streptomyces sp. NBC_00691]
MIAAPAGAVPTVLVKGEILGERDGCIVRGVAGAGRPLVGAALSALEAAGNFCLDPASRFRGPPSKLPTHTKPSLTRVGIASAVVASGNRPLGAAELDLVLSRANVRFPVMVKPARGSKGDGVHRCDTMAELLASVSTVRHNDMIIQNFVQIGAEYRAVTLNGRLLGVAEKLADPDTIVRNAATGALFEAASARDVQKIRQYLAGIPGRRGLVGWDIALTGREPTGEDRYLVIERNSTPQWHAFQAATGIDVAAQVMDEFVAHVKRS